MAYAVLSERCVGCNTPHLPSELERHLCSHCRTDLRRDTDKEVSAQRERDAALVEAAEDQIAITLDRYTASGHGRDFGLIATAITTDLADLIREQKT